MLKIMVQYTTLNIVVWIKCRTGCEELVSCYGQGFREEICVILQTRDEHSAEVTLSNPVPDPTYGTKHLQQVGMFLIG